MKIFLFCFAIIGWLLGLMVHILSVVGVDVAETFPYIWLLHVGIFVVWIPAVIYLKQNTELTAYQQSGIMANLNPIGFAKILFKHTPVWLIIIAVAGLLYAVVNFALFMFSQHGTPKMDNGQFTLTNHGELIKILTEKEYHQLRANELRGFSGHWIAFYGLATAVLYPTISKISNKQKNV